MKRKIKIFFLTIVLVLPIFPVFGKTQERLLIEASYDIEKRGSVYANLELKTKHINFYFDSNWWEKLSEEEREEYKKIAYNLGSEFENKIFPQIKEGFGEIPKHSVVGYDERISVLFHPMNDGSGGYFRSGDQYSIYQYPRSNEKNILYLNTNLLDDLNLPGYLAHEYIHLVTFNEKNRKYDINEEVWLNEMRAEAIITILGYDKKHKGSNLEGRLNNFLRDPDISLTEWTEQSADYGVINIFAQYLLDHYGKEIFIDSLKTDIVGIPSIDYALHKNKKGKTFSEIFTDFTIAVYLNDCSYGKYYCFKNKNLSNFKVHPTTIFITTRDEGFHEISYQTKNWAGNWFRFVGPSGIFKLKFSSTGRFTVPYVICQKDNKCEIKFLKTDSLGRGEIVIGDFNSIYESVTILPSLRQKYSGFNGAEKTVKFDLKIEVKEDLAKIEQENRERLQQKLISLVEKIKKIYLFLDKEMPSFVTVKKIENNLYYGMTNSSEVENLQIFLEKQGVYPEGLITGNFYNFTKKAVISFQELYRQEILEPLGLSQGTGYVGEKTREVINYLLERR
jgi:hypothetical protein